ncbi:MAG: hypothetical protein CL424_04995 [Acidimicrobiaceae bacterium]|nr:hypothetical protein [Acidimicrobiaceae bacterium]
MTRSRRLGPFARLGIGGLLASVGLTGVLAACGDDDRPSDAAWSAIWDGERALVPTEAEFVVGGRELCDQLVGLYRERFDDLTPTPSEGLDDAVAAWSDQAEQIAFDCPDDPDVVATEYEALRRLEAEVDAGSGAGG